ncbi:helix-turn-helix transcriptional regulator [Rhizobium oryzihabitans]|uniref:Helix-turn-helix transcriptional regulator n=1 Tax=Rhizobium oryzihabitans TaxID=2267833 RepID=A0A7L5BCN6_9HYPH|nr:helix-turn-helix transcriptional regulator [Rhizobium oryzihabitans]QIB36601.1 helix-turn-helix transcriptional regulator [Rhizobium oryzihabitans]
MTITADQLRAARALLKMEQRALAEAADVPVQTLKRYEGSTGPLTGNYQNISSIIRVLEEAGVIFVGDGDVSVGGPGVRLGKISPEGVGHFVGNG